MMRRIALAALMVTLLASIGWGQFGRDNRRDALAAALPSAAHGEPCDAQTSGQPVHHAGVVIVFPDGTETYCVAFTEDEISGEQLIERTGLSLVVSGFGGLGGGVCRIADIGCSDPGNCFCQCQGADCHYWNYYRLDGETWRIQGVGMSTRRVRDGDVDGWVWGNGHTPPGAASIGKLCSAVKPTRLPTVTPIPPSSGGASPVATLTLQNAVPIGSAGSKSTPEPPAASTPRLTRALDPTATSQPQVIRRSTRPPSEVAGKERLSNDGGGGLPAGLLAFAGVAGGLIVVAGGFAVRGKLRG